MPAGFIPKREFDSIPEPKFVIDHAEMVFHHMLGGADDVGNFAVFEALGD